MESGGINFSDIFTNLLMESGSVPQDKPHRVWETGCEAVGPLEPNQSNSHQVSVQAQPSGLAQLSDLQRVQPNAISEPTSEILIPQSEGITDQVQTGSDQEAQAVTGQTKVLTDQEAQAVTGQTKLLTDQEVQAITGQTKVLTDQEVQAVTGQTKVLTDQEAQAVIGQTKILTGREAQAVTGQTKILTGQEAQAITGQTKTLTGQEAQTVTGQTKNVTDQEVQATAGKTKVVTDQHIQVATVHQQLAAEKPRPNNQSPNQDLLESVGSPDRQRESVKGSVAEVFEKYPYQQALRAPSFLEQDVGAGKSEKQNEEAISLKANQNEVVEVEKVVFERPSTQGSSDNFQAVAKNTAITDKGSALPVAHQNTIYNQVVKHFNFISKNGLDQLQMTLKPDFLGQININLSIENGKMVGKILVEREEVKRLLENEVKTLKQVLSQINVKVEDLIVEPLRATKEMGADKGNLLYQDMGNQRQSQSQDPNQTSEFSAENSNLGHETTVDVTIPQARNEVNYIV